MGTFTRFLANSDLVVQSVLEVDLVGDDSHSQARPCLRGKETARGAVLEEEEKVPLSPRRSTVVLRHRGPLETLVVTICIHT